MEDAAFERRKALRAARHHQDDMQIAVKRFHAPPEHVERMLERLLVELRIGSHSTRDGWL